MRTRVLCLLVLALVAVPMFAQKAPKSTAGTLTLGTAVNEPIFEFSFGVSQTLGAPGGGGGVGKATFDDFTMTKPLTKASADRFLACAQGRHFPSAVITVLDGKGNAVARVTLTDVLISSYSVESNSEGTVEKVSIVAPPEKISYEILIGL